jgi:hypothetical protein
LLVLVTDAKGKRRRGGEKEEKKIGGNQLPI